MTGTESIRVEAECAGERLDRYLSKRPELSLSRSYAERLIGEGRVLLDGQAEKPSKRLRGGEQISICFPEEKPTEIRAEEIPLDIVYEDSELLLVNKPKGMVVHPAPGHSGGTLVNALLGRPGPELSSINGVLRPGIVHRIDRDTTGLLLVCKTDRAHRALAEQLKEHTITRRYHAILCGRMREDEGKADAPIGRSRRDRKKQAIDWERGREAVTHYRVLERFSEYTLVECRLETGRTHQIRVHMASIGHPVLGDEVYGPRHCPFRLEGQCLHAKLLGFVHPVSGKYMEFDSEYPAYFEELLQKLRRMS